MRRKRERARQSGKKRKFNRGKREGDWLLRRTSVLPFWRSSSYTLATKNSLKGWSRSRRSGIWWSCSFEKTGTSEITGCHLGNWVGLTDCCDLFFVCEVDITSHLINETPCGPYQEELGHWQWWLTKEKEKFCRSQISWVSRQYLSPVWQVASCTIRC